MCVWGGGGGWGRTLDGILIGGTFKYCPTFFMQLYTIHGKMNGHYKYAISILSVTKQDTRYIPQIVDSYNRRLPCLCIMLSKNSSLVHPWANGRSTGNCPKYLRSIDEQGF